MEKNNPQIVAKISRTFTIGAILSAGKSANINSIAKIMAGRRKQIPKTRKFSFPLFLIA